MPAKDKIKKKGKAAAKAIKEYFTDWYKTDVLKELLENQAISQRRHILSAETLEMKFGSGVRDRIARQAVISGTDENPTADEVFNTFMFSGIDYRGQAQSGLEALGYGGGVNVSVDLAKLDPVIAGNFVTATLKTAASGSKATFQFVYVGHLGNPMDYDLRDRSLSNWTPILGTSMLGVANNFKAELGAEVGFKVDTSTFTGIASGAENGAIAFGAGAKITGEGKIAYSGTWIYSTNWHPRFYSRDSRNNLQIDIIEDLGTAEMTRRVGNLVFYKPNPECYLNWSIHEPDASATVGASANATAAAGSYDSSKSKGLGFGVNAGASAKTGLEYAGKYSFYRLNLPAPDGALIVSQETRIKYTKVSFTGIALSLGLQLGPSTTSLKKDLADRINPAIPKKNIRLNPKPELMDSPTDFGQAFIPEQAVGSGVKLSETIDIPELKIFEGDLKYAKIKISSKGFAVGILEDQFNKLKKSTAKDFLNALSYEAGMAVWNKQYAETPVLAEERRKMFATGTGLIRGQSITLPTLFSFFSIYATMEDFFGEGAIDDPQYINIKNSIKHLINTQLISSKTDLPTTLQWLNDSYSATARRTIKEIDNALTKFWEIQNKFGKLYGSTDPAAALFAEAERKIKKSGKTNEQIQQEICSTVVDMVLTQLKARAKAYIALLKAIEGWIKHKVKSGDIDDLIRVSPDRGPQVVSLNMRARVDFKNIDSVASIFDVLEEFFALKQTEKKMSESLMVSLDQFRAFLDSDEINDTVMGFVSLMETNPDQVPGAFVIESTFKLDAGDIRSLNGRFTMGANSLVNDSGDDLNEGFTQKIHDLIKDNSEDKLQSISIRYRRGDSKSAERTFKLGFGTGTLVGFGIKLDRVRKSASDSSFVAGIYWFNGFKEYNRGTDGKLGWPDGTVSTPILLT